MSFVVFIYFVVGFTTISICNEFGLGSRLLEGFEIGFKSDPFSPKALTNFALVTFAIFWPIWLLAVTVSVVQGEKPW
jgi:hypothetical protein